MKKLQEKWMEANPETGESPEIKYWLAVDPETGNPTGDACWAVFPGDLPAVGFWIEVKATGITTDG